MSGERLYRDITKPYKLNRHFSDDLDQWIIGTTFWDKTDRSVWYYVFDHLSGTPVPIKYNKNTHQWVFIALNTRSRNWMSRPETQQGTAATHSLESRGWASSAGLKHSKAQQPLTNWRAGGWASSAGLKHNKAQQPLTNWRAEDRHHQQAWNTARHSSHSPTGEQRMGIINRLETQQGTAATHHLESRGQVTGIISRLETQQGTAATHSLESRGQASSAGLKHSKVQQPLTFWRAEDRHHQQAWNTARHSSHSLTGG